MTSVDVMPMRHAELEIAAFDTEYVVFDPRVNRVHHLRDLAAVVFDACDGTTATDAFVAEVCDAAAIEAAEARSAIDSALVALADAGLLAGSEPPADPPPCISCGDDAGGARRRGLRRLLRLGQ